MNDLRRAVVCGTRARAASCVHRDGEWQQVMLVISNDLFAVSRGRGGRAALTAVVARARPQPARPHVLLGAHVAVTSACSCTFCVHFPFFPTLSLRGCGAFPPLLPKAVRVDPSLLELFPLFVE
jgi:hypothetical protein